MVLLKDVWACLDCCFKGKCWYILKVISFIYIYIIYKFTCSDCNVTYIGKTDCHLVPC